MWSRLGEPSADALVHTGAVNLITFHVLFYRSVAESVEMLAEVTHQCVTAYSPPSYEPNMSHISRYESFVTHI